MRGVRQMSLRARVKREGSGLAGLGDGLKDIL